ncbi:hypothetical protein M0Q50_09355 [bacterium]|jgi:hypothetical protein|nr:hypothetical protein [bacterium]
MKKYNFYINESKEEDYEKIFLKYSHIDKLEIKFDFFEYDECLLFFYKNKYIFAIRYNDNKGYFYMSCRFLSRFKINGSVSSNNILYDIVKKYFNLKINIYDIVCDDDEEMQGITDDFNI